jgi:hypothetical protein
MTAPQTRRRQCSRRTEKIGRGSHSRQ